MSMFCFQCQEAAKNSGCTVRGVCGKTEDVANLQDLLIHTMKGISFPKLMQWIVSRVEKKAIAATTGTNR